MPELRLNLITRNWVVIAAERAKRPDEFKKSGYIRKELPSHVDTCPFCHGNESKTPGEIFRIPAGRDWKIRVVPNKFPILSSGGERIRTKDGIKHTISGVGIHDMVIETPLHNMTTALLHVEQITDIIRTYKDRFIALHQDHRIEHVMIFKNSGTGAGTTIEHPISHIVGIPVTPIQFRDRFEAAVHFFDDTGECLMCMTARREKEEGIRIILDTDHFLTFVPYAALSPFHIWIFPKRHSASFSDITDDEAKDLANTFKTIFSKFYYGLDNPDFNYVLRSHRPRDCDAEYFHWYISIVPRFVKAAGFELGSGMYVNPSIPEESAAFLRQVKI